MADAIYTASTGMLAQQMNLDVISNNLANVNTVGFKRSRAAFQDLLYDTVTPSGTPSGSGTQIPAGIQIGLGVELVAVNKLFTQGDFKQTGNDLDLVIEGNGFFQISRPDGTIAYTRAGNFQIDSEGRIVNTEGYPLEPAITVPSNTTKITVSHDGIVSVLESGNVTPVEIGNIELAYVTNPAGLQAAGKNLFLETEASGAPTVGTPGSDGLGGLNQGFVENSNVNVVEELANLLFAQRAFEFNSKALEAANQMLQTAGTVA